MTSANCVRAGVRSLILAVLVLVGFGPGAVAVHAFQGADGGGAAALSAGEVSISMEKFGVGNEFRAGDWAGLRIKLKDNGTTQRDVVIRVSMVDPDGDYPTYQRATTLNPGVEQSTWVYVRVPFRFRQGDAVSVAVYERIDGEIGRLIGQAQMVANRLGASSQGLIGLVGTRKMGLGRYMDAAEGDGMGTRQQPWLTYGHERTVIIDGLKPEELPDRWMGLSAMSTIVWSEGEPAQLRDDRAKAVREWVMRGGHLVIVLPQVGQTWTNDQSNDLIDIMPLVAVRRNENVDMAPYRPLVNARVAALDRYPKQGTVHTFRRLDQAKLHEAVPILNGPDGQAVVVRRLVGEGAVTLIGLDLSQASLSDSLDAEVFWHRVLGRRGQLADDPKSPTAPGPAMSGVNRATEKYDQHLSGMIAQTGRTAVGVFAGFVMFVTYWIVAGPLGYAILKSRGKQRHAWVAFLGATLLFTAVAWGGAALLRPAKLEAKHVTFLDHVYGQPLQRARTWASVLIPWYGTARIEVDGDRTDETRSLSTVAPWDAEGDESSWSGFPDSRPYLIDSRRPDVMEVPTRSTAKQVQIDWAGGPAWEMPRPTAPGGEGVGDIRLSGDWAIPGKPIVTGSLVHKLPGKLRDVTIIVVRQQTTLIAPSRGIRGLAFSRAPLQAMAFELTEWAPDMELDLALHTLYSTGTNQPSTDFHSYLNRLKPSWVGQQQYWSGSTGVVDPRDAPRYMKALALFPLLPPPEDTNQGSDYVAQRSSAHTYDIARWLTQPCVVVIALLGDDNDPVESPVPIKVDGEKIRTYGLTVVRWMYPLAPNPPAFPAVEAPAGQGSEGDGKGAGLEPL